MKAPIHDPARILRGDIWLAALDPTVGREIQKTRPCVVIAPDDLNAFLSTIIVAPMTTGSRPAPFRIPVSFEGKTGLVLLEQMRALDRRRFVRRLGAIAPSTLALVLQRLGAMFAP